jgi:uncharacterized surface protein with fasciclin (FAS1) repeats
MTKKTFYPGFLLFIAVLFFISCEKNNDAPVYPGLDAYLTSAGNLTIFKAAIEKAQLQSFIEGQGPYTWIAPTDAAFQTALITIDSLNRMTTGQVSYLVMYHLINAAVTTTDMVGQNSFPKATQLSTTDNVYIGQLSNSFYVNGGTLASTDNYVSNGVVHISNRLNIPPNLRGNIQGILNTSGQHSLFIAALTRANRWAVLGTTSTFTVFAPTDASMTAAGYSVASINAATIGAMDSLVRYHMISGTRLFTNDIGNKTLPGTFLGTTFTLAGSSNGTKIKGKTNAAAFDITKPDFLGTNGVVHTTNGVLKF